MSFANEKANHAIECHVSQCNNHCGCEDYCTLDKVCIGTHEANPKMDQCTDCLSFVEGCGGADGKAAGKHRH